MSMEQNIWKDISDEVEREYIYPDHSLKINSPSLLMVSPSSLGGHAHRIQTADGNAYYIASGWAAIRWTVKDGKDLFKF